MLQKIATSKLYILIWILLSITGLIFSAIYSYNNMSCIFALTLMNAISDLILEYYYSLGVYKWLLGFNSISNILGIIVQLSYNIYGAVFAYIVELVIILIKYISWDNEKDGRITHIKLNESNFIKTSYVLGFIALVLIYSTYFRGESLLIIVLNIIVFSLRLISRYLLVNGKLESQLTYILSEIVTLLLYGVLMYTQSVSTVLLMKFASVTSSFFILIRGYYIWKSKLEQA